MRWLCALLAGTLLLAGCSDDDPGAPDAGQGATASNIATELETAVDEQHEAAGDDLDTLRAVIVAQHGEIVLERYYDGAGPDDYWDVASVTKSILGTLVGIAVADGDIPGLDATLGDLLPEYRSDMTPALAGATLEQLLTMTAGTAGTFDHSDDAWVTSPEPIETILTTATGTPGEHFAYSNGGTHLIGAVLERATGTELVPYAREKLFDPLDVDTRPAYEPLPLEENVDEFDAADFAWWTDKQGLNAGSCCIKLRPRDLVSIGTLYLDGGAWEGEQLVPEGWVRESTTTQVDTRGYAAADNGYGYLWWTGELDGHPSYLAWGFGGQAIRVVPDQDLVVVLASALPSGPTDQGVPYYAGLFLTDEIIAPLLVDQPRDEAAGRHRSRAATLRPCGC
ncbi:MULTISPECIES: serine hydrolase domain-containing protein [unclassified Nocardioides]|uniref:serine hydrolase domain-containing protein n=1 Tax=unclassified Nocardioides TaxID=2615069 RepID=UPI003612E202